ncbi:MAG: hypothetical protein AVDCRST_MAG56-3235, partial [uncultured Cytophagales bacterium]
DVFAGGRARAGVRRSDLPRHRAQRLAEVHPVRGRQRLAGAALRAHPRQLLVVPVVLRFRRDGGLPASTIGRPGHGHRIPRDQQRHGPAGTAPV